MKKRVSLLLVVAMLLSLLPVGAFAAEATELISVVDEAVTAAGYTFEYTAETAGVMNVSVGTCSPGWRYRIYYPDGTESIYRTKWSAGTSCDYDVTAGTYKIVFYAYSSAEADNVAGTVSFSVSFTPAEGEAEVQKAEYEVSKTKLDVGDNAVTMLDTAVTTIFVFEPSETAVFSFTAPAGTVLGYWGAGSWFLSDPHSTTNTYEWTCTGVGQTAYIGVSGAEGTVNIHVKKTGTYEVVEIPIVPYENKAELTPFEKPEGAVWGSYVDVMDENVTHTAVLGADGYYHLDSVDGDVLVVNLKYQDIILSAALQSDRPVMYAYVTDDAGKTVKYDIGNAIKEYEAVMDASGYYPVTEDILLFYQVYAMGAGTFTYHLGGGYNEECVWMYCMRTMNMDNVTPTEPSEPETEPSEPETQPSEPETQPSEPETEPTKPAPSVPEVPENGQLIMAENAVADSGSKYTYAYTPAVDGTLTVTVGDGTTNWKSDVMYFQNLNTMVLAEASGSAATTYTAAVTAGTTYRVRVWAVTGELVETPVIVVFTPNSAEIDQPDNGGVVAEVANQAVTTAGYVVSYTADTAGTMHVSVGDCSPGWRYKVFSPDGVESSYRSKFTAGTECDYHNIAGNWKIVFYAYSSAEADNVDGTVSFTVTFTPDEGEVPEPSEPETQPSEPETEPSEPETEPTVPSEPETQPTTPSQPENLLTATDLAVTAEGYTVTISAQTTGTLNVTMGNCSPGWRYNVVGPNYESGNRGPYSAGASCDYAVTAAGQWRVTFYAYSSAEAGFVDGTVSYAVTFTPDAPEPSEPETEPSEPETEPTVPGPTVPDISDDDVPADAYYSITVNGTTTYYSSSAYTALNAALKKITGSGYLKFYRDINLGSNGTIDVYNGNITVDLNGCTVTGNFVGTGALYVDNGNVTLVDTSAEGNGIIQNENKSGHGIEIHHGSVIMLSGNVIAGSNGQGVKVWNNTSFTMYGGYAVGASYGVNVLSSASATIYGGTLENTKTSLAYPLYAAGGAIVSISGGYFKGGAISGAGLNGTISGGYFVKTFNTAYLAADCELQDNADATYLFKVFNPNAQPEEPAEPVAQVGDTQYTSLAEAIAAAGNSIVKLLADCNEDVAVDADLYLDLNGFAINGTVTVAEGTTLYGMDTATDGYDCSNGYGKISSIDGNYALHHKTTVNNNPQRYLAVVEEDGISFHRFYIGIQSVNLKPGVAGFGYKAIFGGDEMVKAALSQEDAFGYSLWLIKGHAISKSTGADQFLTGKEGTPLTLSLKNMDVATYGSTPVYATVYITLANGTRIESAEYSCSMQQMLEQVNADIAKYNDVQIQAVQAMLAPYADAVSSWNIADILNWKSQEAA